MGKILADAVALLEHFTERRRDHGRLGIVFELAPDAMHQVDRADQHADAGGKARGRIGRDRRQHRHQRTREHIAHRRRRPETGRDEGSVARGLPGRARRGAAGGAARDRDAGAGSDAQIPVQCLDDHALGKGAEEVAARGPLGRPRADLDAVRDQLLSVAVSRLQPQRAAGETDRTFVGIGGDVADVVDHASPVSFSGRLALGPCGK